MKQLLAIGSVAALVLGQSAILRAQDPPEPRNETVHAFTLRVTGDGHVEMTVKENGQEKTYKADSMDEFTRQYPDLARQYRIGRGGMKAWKFQDPGEFSRKFEEWRKQFGDSEVWKPDPELEKLLEHPEELFREHLLPKTERPAEAPQAPTGPRLGVRLAPLSQVLADQLGLEAKSGSLIDDIEPGSLAEKSGLKKNDVLVKIDGKEASGLESIRAAVGDALKKKEFDLEILRQAKRQTVRVQVPAQK
jgi:membrane-associated protease RseP (regulator of RpoE activity)